MAQQTLLDIVQGILSEMNSDPVNDISDTAEAMQVARLVKRTFTDLVNDRLWPGNRKLAALVASSDPAQPAHMSLPDNVREIEWVKYDVRDSGSDPITLRSIIYKEPEAFIELVMSRDASAANVLTVVDNSGRPLLILSDASPTYYTSFDDKHLVFDSYDSAVDSTLQASKTQLYVEVEPEFLLENDFIPEMPTKFFPLLVSEATAAAFLKVKEVFSATDAASARRQRHFLSRRPKRASDNGYKRPDFGRKRR